MGTPIPLTALEASFMALERPGLPMHVAGVLLVDASSGAGGPLTLKDLRRLVTSRLSRLPTFKRCVSFGLFGLSRPAWVETKELNINAHLFEHRVRAPGRSSQLSALCAQIHAERLSRDRPLWEIHLINGLADDRQAVVIKAHHAITDGIAGMQVAEVLFDRARPFRKVKDENPQAPRFARAMLPTAIDTAQALLGAAFTVAGGPIALHGPFNGRVGSRRAFAMATIPTAVVRRFKQCLGGSVDDVLLAVVAAGLTRHLMRQEHPGLPPALRAMLPVSTRPSTDNSRIGNCVTAVFVDLPLGNTDLPALVRRIATSKSTLRSVHAASGSSLLIDAAARLPRPLHETVVRLVSTLPFANLVLSDVPGSDDPLFVLGRLILACYPMIPLSPAVGLSVAAVTMGGQIGIGIVADPNLVAKPQSLAREIEAAVRSFERSLLARRSPGRMRRAHRRAA